MRTFFSDHEAVRMSFFGAIVITTVLFTLFHLPVVPAIAGVLI